MGAFSAGILLLSALCVLLFWRRVEVRTQTIRASLESTADGIVVLDTAGRHVAVNRKFREMFHVPEAVLKAHDRDALLEFILPQMKDAGAFLEMVTHVKANHEAKVSDVIELADGRVFERHSEPEHVRGRNVGRVWGFRDITESKRAQEDLYSSRQMLQLVLNNIPQRVFWKDRNLTYLGCNGAFANDVGLQSPAEIIGMSDFDFCPRAAAEKYRSDDRLVMEQESPKLNFEEPMRRKDGSSLKLCTTKLPLRDREGGVIGVIGTYEDITEREKSEKIKAAMYRCSDAANSARNLKELFSAIHGIIADLMPAKNFYISLFDPESGLLSFPYFVDEFDDTPAPKKLGRGLTEYVFRTGRPLLASPEVFEKLVSMGEVERIGAPSIDWLGVPLKSEEQTVGVMVVQSYIEDIRFGEREKEVLLFMSGQVATTIKRKRAEENLEERTAYLNALIENSPLGIVAVDTENKVEFCNPAFEQLFQYRREEIVGKSIDQLISPPGHLPESNEYSKRTQAGHPVHGTGPRCRKDGTSVEVELYGVPLKLGNRVRGVYGLYQDITERKRAEQELHAAKEAAEAASRAKGDFLANMSHEIRTPMNGIVGMTELTLDTQLTGEQREYLGMVKTSAEALLTIINDVLDFSKIEAGKLDLDPIAFGLRDSLAQTMKPLALRAQQKCLELSWDVSPEVPDEIIADPFRLRQILMNLVGNAIKFTERGKVRLDVALEAKRGDHDVLHFTVQDTGIGIPPEKQKIVFEAFSQADSSTVRKFGGTGLGLTISSKLVDLMHGLIWLESELGKGSCFHFTAQVGVATHGPQTKAGKAAAFAGLPVPLVNNSPADLVPGEMREPPRALKVLLIEDNVVNQRLVSGLLEKRGHTVVIAADWHEAMQALEARKFELVMLDEQMAEMDGFETMKAICAREDGSEARIPIIAMTAPATAGGSDRHLGTDAYVSKPIKAKELDETIETLMTVPA